MSYGFLFINFSLNNNKCIQLNNKIQSNTFSRKKYKKLIQKFEKVNEDYIDKHLKYLLIQRRNSISIIELIRGKYKLDDIDYLNNIFYLIPANEKQLLINKSFDELWNFIWNGSINNKVFLSEYK